MYNNYHKYNIGDIGQIRKGRVINIEFDKAKIELSDNQKGIMYKEDFPPSIKIGQEVRVIIAYTALKYFIVELMNKK